MTGFSFFLKVLIMNNLNKRYCIVYLTTCLKNNKKYVGSHICDKLDDGYLGSGHMIKKAIKKYGKENFGREILEYCEVIDDARNLEYNYINEYNTLTPNGYNISKSGGANLSGHKLSDKQKILISENNAKYWSGKKRSDKTKEKISKSHKNKTTGRKGKGFKKEFIEKYGESIGEIKYNEFINKQRKSHLGKKHSEETLSKKSKSMKGKNKGPKSEETKRKISESLKRRYEIIDESSKSL